MCVALICPPKVRPSLPLLIACESANPHGAGIAWRSKGRVHWRKALTAAQVHQLAQETSGELVIHFRWASVGGVDPKLCHPFPITAAVELKDAGSAKSVLFHNGTWADWREVLERTPDAPKLEGPCSDSRVAASLSHHVENTRWLRKLPGRWAVMKRSEVELYGDWQQYRGMLVSNRNFEPHLKRKETSKAPAARAPQQAPTLRPASPVDDLYSRRFAEWKRMHGIRG